MARCDALCLTDRWFLLSRREQRLSGGVSCTRTWSCASVLGLSVGCSRRCSGPERGRDLADLAFHAAADVQRERDAQRMPLGAEAASPPGDARRPAPGSPRSAGRGAVGRSCRGPSTGTRTARVPTAKVASLRARCRGVSRAEGYGGAAAGFAAGAARCIAVTRVSPAPAARSSASCVSSSVSPKPRSSELGEDRALADACPQEAYDVGGRERGIARRRAGQSGEQQHRDERPHHRDLREAICLRPAVSDSGEDAHLPLRMRPRSAARQDVRARFAQALRIEHRAGAARSRGLP